MKNSWLTELYWEPITKLIPKQYGIQSVGVAQHEKYIYPYSLCCDAQIKANNLQSYYLCSVCKVILWKYKASQPMAFVVTDPATNIDSLKQTIHEWTGIPVADLSLELSWKEAV